MTASKRKQVLSQVKADFNPDRDTAIVPTVAFLASAIVVRHIGAEVLFSAANPDSGLMEARGFCEAIDKKKTNKDYFPCPPRGADSKHG